MRYQPLSQNFYKNNRKNFISRLKENSLAIFHSNDVMPTNADGVMGFRQNNDLFYLSGIDQEETIFVIGSDGTETLFIKETSELIKIWEGAKLTKQQAAALSGVDDVLWTDEYKPWIVQKLKDVQSLYISKNEHARHSSEVQTRNERMFSELALTEQIKVESSAPILQQMRYVKQTPEIQQIQIACDITEKAFRRVLKSLKPGVTEHEIEAEITHEFLINKSRGHAYAPIVASGANACVLHYIDNNDVCKEGDLVLMDFGAEYGNYNADLTRTIPANGKFSPRQKDVYQATLRIHNLAKELLVPGGTFEQLNTEVARAMELELIGLGLFDHTDVKNQDKNNPLYRKYFMHGTSHSLGLDVHDVDDRTIPFQEGMVFTCEPGIYIIEEGIGIRIENDIALTSQGNTDLMKNIPIEVEEIENIMNK